MRTPWTRTGDRRVRPSEPRAQRLVMLNWRDQAHPEGGGAEVYLERIAEHLVSQGREVTIVCSRHSDAPQDELLESGVRIIRRGRRFSVYPYAAASVALGRFGHLGGFDAIVDVQNGVPFWTPLLSRRPVVMLCHHVHREQWGVVFGPLTARLGWWLESVVSPRIYRRTRYVTVSEVSRDELVELGVDRHRITVVHNGVDEPLPSTTSTPSRGPQLLVLGRLVPHKRVEFAIDAVAALAERFPGLHLVVAGHGYWHDRLAEYARQRGVSDRVRLAGFVSEAERSQLLRSSDLMLMPSLKEGWGLTVMEAAAHGTPSVAFANAGGVAECVVDGVTGVLVRDPDGFVTAVGDLLEDHERRRSMGEKAKLRAREFRWSQTAARFARVLDEEYLRALPGRPSPGSSDGRTGSAADVSEHGSRSGERSVTA